MKKIMVYAYTSLNLGDDLFIKILCERYPNTRFYLQAPKKYISTFKHINNLTIFPSDTFIKRSINFTLQKIGLSGGTQKLISKRCDAAIYIGGSLFIQGKSWKKVLIQKRSFKIKNKPFYLLGVNFGPYLDKNFFLEYKKVFNNYTDICFRDTYSYNLFKNKLSNVRVAGDIVFLLKTQKTNRKDGKNIIISVIKPSYRSHLLQCDDIYYHKVKEIIIFFVNKGYTVTLMGFCEFEGDYEAVSEIKKLIPKDYLKINAINYYIYRGNIEEALNIIEKSYFVIATRFHAMILGWVYNKPVFPIVYSEKMTNVMKDVGFKGIYTDFDNIKNVSPKQIFDNMKTNVIDVSGQIKDAEKQFEKLDQYLLN